MSATIPLLPLGNKHPGPTKTRLDARILVVVENSLIMLDVQDSLKEAGLRMIHSTASATIGLEMLGQQRFDVAILGMGSADPSSRTITERIGRCSIPMIMLGTGAGPLPEQSEESARYVISVPFDTEALAAALNSSLTSKAS